MADVRTHTVQGTTYTLDGLGARAEEIAGAAAVAEVMVEARLGAARRALEQWHGPHAATFAEAAGAVAMRAVSLVTALRARRAHLANFPAPVSTSWAQVRLQDAAYASTHLPGPPLPPAGGAAGADPAALRGYVDTSAGLARQAPALAATVHLRGITGSATIARPLDAAERDAQLSAGIPAATVAGATVAVTRPLSPGEIAALVGLGGVEGEAAALVGAAAGVEAFTAAVATAFETADVGLLAALAPVDAHNVGTATADVVIARLLASDTDTDTDTGELERTIAVLGVLAARSPAAVSASFSGSELTALISRLDALQGSGALDVQGRYVTPLAAVLADAFGSGSDPLARDRFVDEAGVHALAVIMTSARFDPAVVLRAFDRLWGANPTSVMPLADRYGGDLRQAALATLASDRDLAGATLAADPVLTDQILHSWYSDGGTAAASMLMSVFHDRVLHDLAVDAADTVSLLESQAVLIAAVGGGADHLDPVRAALASVAGLHLDEIASVAEYGAPSGALGAVDRTALVDFYAELFRSAEAQRRAAAGLGVYAAVSFEAAARRAEALPPWERDFGVPSADVGHITRLFEDAVIEGNDDLARADRLWAMLAETAATVGVDVGLPALGVTGGWSAVLGAGGAVVIGGISAALPVPTLPDVEENHRSVARQAVAARVLADHPGLVSTPLAPDDLARLRDDGFMEAVGRGDAAAVGAFLDIVDAPENAGFKADVLDVLQGAAIADRVDTPD